MLLAVTKRSSTIETKHEGFYASIIEGRFSISEKQAERTNVCLRSSAKPFQVLACLNLISSKVPLSLKDIAISTASHSGTDKHLDVVRELLNKNNVEWQELRCGEHAPLDRSVNYFINDPKKRRLQNNCSGKHSLMVITCKLMNWDSKNYFSPSHPLQNEILRTVAELCELPTSSIEVAVDGCGVPSFSLPVRNILLGFGKFNLASQSANILKITNAMLSEAFFVSGSGRLDYEITKAFENKLVSKSGACGLTLISFLDKPDSALMLKLYDSEEKVRALLIKEIIEKHGYIINSQAKLFRREIQNLHGHDAASVETFLNVF
ncbi:MAG: asparaginase [Candidatus Caenarcaniphilales bacterium]|nr:asparaginase [Candidatus Caenarcaniphilales bacterium]